MRVPRRRAVAVTAAVSISVGLAFSADIAEAARSFPVRAVAWGERLHGGHRDADPRTRYRVTCRTEVTGSQVVAHCHNPYPVTDVVGLHIECARWWDVDSDSAPVRLQPAGYVSIAGRCWKEVASAWVSRTPSAGRT